jgi:hypothetical protein
MSYRSRVYKNHPANKYVDWNELVEDVTNGSTDSLTYILKDENTNTEDLKHDLKKSDIFKTIDTFEPHDLSNQFDGKVPKLECFESTGQYVIRPGLCFNHYRQKLWTNSKEILSLIINLYDDNLALIFTYGSKDTFIHIDISKDETIVIVPAGVINLKPFEIHYISVYNQPLRGILRTILANLLLGLI